jgi:hypothetical protein
MRDIETIVPSCGWWRLFAGRLGSPAVAATVITQVRIDQRSLLSVHS